MRYILSILLFIPLCGFAKGNPIDSTIKSIFVKPWSGTIYYVKNGGGTGSGLDDANAWSLSKLNSVVPGPDDSVVFKAGDVFNGRLLTIYNGTPGHPVRVGKYGTGANPVINGFTTLSFADSGNFHYATLDVASLPIVTIDGVVKTMGRYPNTSYLYITSHSDSSISDATVASIPFNPAGAEVAIRTDRFVIDRYPIKNRSSSTLNYTIVNSYGSSQWPALDSNGYFIQNAMATLDQDGEWYYNPVSKRLYIYKVGSLSGNVVKAGLYDNLVYTGSAGYLSFTNIDFQGANSRIISHADADYVTYSNCNFKYSGGDGMYFIGARNCSATNCTVDWCLNNGISGEDALNRFSATGCTVTHIGTVAGSSRGGSGTGIGIALSSDTANVRNNIVKSCGYHGIDVNGNRANIRNNSLDSTCLQKDDGAAIYTFQGANDTIANNVIRNAIGNFDGAHGGSNSLFGLAAGIYIDNGDLNRNAVVMNNDIQIVGWTSLFNNGTAGNQYIGNYCKGFGKYGSYIISYSQRVRRLVDSANSFIVTASGQIPRMVEVQNPDTIPVFGRFKKNFYSNPYSSTTVVVKFTYSSTTNNLTLSQWQTTYGHDIGSYTAIKLIKTPGEKLLKTPDGKPIVVTQ